MKKLLRDQFEYSLFTVIAMFVIIVMFMSYKAMFSEYTLTDATAFAMLYFGWALPILFSDVVFEKEMLKE